MQKLNKKLFADTPATEKIDLLSQRAEEFIKAGLFDQCIQILMSIRHLILNKNYTEEEFKQLTAEINSLKTLPKIIKQKETKINIQNEENKWKELLEQFNHDLEIALIRDEDIKTESYKDRFEELKKSRPESLKTPKLHSYHNYVDQLPQHIAYTKMRADAEKEKILHQKRKRNIRIYVASGILGLLSITAGLYLSNSKKVDSKKNNDIHASQEFKKTLRFSIESSSNHLFTILPVRQDNLSFLLKDYIRELNFYIEQTNFLDGDDMNLLNKELLKIENNFNDLTAFAGGRDRVSVLSLGEANRFLNTQNEKADKVREAEKDLHKITSKIYILLYKYYSHYQLKTNIPYIKNNLRSKYHKLIFITDNDWELRKLIKEIKEIID